MTFSFPEILRVQIPSKITKNNSQGIICVIISCQRVRGRRCTPLIKGAGRPKPLVLRCFLSPTPSIKGVNCHPLNWGVVVRARNWKGQTEPNSQFFRSCLQIFAEFYWKLQRWESQETAEFWQKTAGNRQNFAETRLSHLVYPFESLSLRIDWDNCQEITLCGHRPS